jgi:hypothetical protein
MNVLFNKNERIISGKASHLKVANNMTSLSRNLQRSQLGGQSKNSAAPQNTFNKTLNASHVVQASP